jgi:hypothetical protein
VSGGAGCSPGRNRQYPLIAFIVVGTLHATSLPVSSVTNSVAYRDYIDKKKGLASACPFYLLFEVPYFTVSTIVLNASGWFIARSARVFLFSVIPFLSSLPINSE